MTGKKGGDDDLVRRVVVYEGRQIVNRYRECTHVKFILRRRKKWKLKV